MYARDGGDPGHRSNASEVTVLVTRNLHTPQWQGDQPYISNTDETTGAGNRVFAVRATDQDADVRPRLL